MTYVTPTICKSIGQYGQSKSTRHPYPPASHQGGLRQDPLTPSFDELVQHHRDIVQDEAAYVKAEKLGRMAHAKLQSNMRW